jgi:hypothetical protein
MNEDLPKLLRAIAGGTQAQENRHDIIFNAAADELERLRAENRFLFDIIKDDALLVERYNAFNERRLKGEIPTERGHRDKALDLAVCLLGKYEPPDSRAVSDVFVALAAVSCGNDNQECWDIIDRALEMERKQ